MTAQALDFRENPSGFLERQIADFRAKVNIPTRRWDEVWREAHNSGFMVAGAYQADLLDDLRTAVDAAISRGETITQFRARFDEIVQRYGWQYKGSRGWRTRIIMETNVRTAYAAGRYRQLKDPAMLRVRPFWEYKHSDGVRHPRPLHVAWNGTVLDHDDPWWDAHYPPGGFGCRCYVRPLSRRDMAKRGKLGPDTAPNDGTITVERGATGEQLTVPAGIDPGFDYIPGQPATATPSAPPRVGGTVEQIGRHYASRPNPSPSLMRRVISALKSTPAVSARTIRSIVPRRFWDLIASTAALRLSEPPPGDPRG